MLDILDIRDKVLKIDSEDGKKFLRARVEEFDFGKHEKKSIDELIKKMRSLMGSSNGVGLAANQAGLNASLFVAQLDHKFYAVFNPRITKYSDDLAYLEEGCLSVPGKFLGKARSNKVVLEGFDKNGRKVKIKAWGLLARIFQHEVDHLNGRLFIDN